MDKSGAEKMPKRTALKPAVPKEAKRWGLGRVAFLSRRVEIEAAIAEGYPLVVIHETHGLPLSISYKNFARYVRKYLRAARPSPKKRAASTPKAPQHDTTSQAIHPPVAPRFLHNPTARKPEDLI